jgi:CheY-like chemotaxis protein
MKKILIADASKASLVMTSEVFKDHFPGVHVLVARTSAEAIEIAKKEEQIDAFVVDFDLPDKDGAYTAARIKKLYSIPVLITAFDRESVQETIEKHCSAYDDCLSWLAKPVNAELVVSIAHRFIEGSYRTQRRVDCMIPGIAEITLKAKPVRKTAKPSDTKEKQADRLCLPVMLEDCSVGGFKFRIMQKDIEENKNFKFSPQGVLNIDEVVSIFLPSFESIQTGAENVGYWLWGNPAKEKKARSESSQKKTTLSALKRTTRQVIGDKDKDGQAIKGKMIWCSRVSDGDALVGVRSDNLILSKKLFESVLLGEHRRNNNSGTSGGKGGGSGVAVSPLNRTLRSITRPN